MLRLAFGIRTTRPYLIAGPTVGLLVSTPIDDTDVKNSPESLDFGFDFGTGVSFPADKNAVFVESRYAIELINIAYGLFCRHDDCPEVKTKGIQVMAGLAFLLGR